MIITKLKHNEIKEIVNLHKESIVPLWRKLKRRYNLKNIAKYLRKNFYKEKMFVIKEKNKIFAFGSISIENYSGRREANIGILLVSKEKQGEGYGKKMMDFLEKYAKKKRAKEVKLDVLIGNPAVGFYEHRGFKRYKLMMRKNL